MFLPIINVFFGVLLGMVSYYLYTVCPIADVNYKFVSPTLIIIGGIITIVNFISLFTNTTFNIVTGLLIGLTSFLLFILYNEINGCVGGAVSPKTVVVVSLGVCAIYNSVSIAVVGWYALKDNIEIERGRHGEDGGVGLADYGSGDGEDGGYED